MIKVVTDPSVLQLEKYINSYSKDGWRLVSIYKDGIYHIAWLQKDK